MANIKSAVSVSLLTVIVSLYTVLGYAADPVPDPCQSAKAVKSSVPLANGSAGTIVLVPASSKSVHVCGFVVSSPGGGQFQFEYGTGSSCNVGTVALTGGMFQGSFVTPLAYSGPGTILSVPAGNALCVVTSIPLAGVLTYTQP
jgi:hypothetical protein